jgi:hypothetical protein
MTNNLHMENMIHMAGYKDLEVQYFCSTASLEGQDCMLYEYEDKAKQRFVDQISILKTNKH